MFCPLQSAFAPRPGDLLAEYFFAARCLELGEVGGEGLDGGRDASIAINHAAILHQNFASEKPQRFMTLAPDPDILTYV